MRPHSTRLLLLLTVCLLILSLGGCRLLARGVTSRLSADLQSAASAVASAAGSLAAEVESDLQEAASDLAEAVSELEKEDSDSGAPAASGWDPDVPQRQYLLDEGCLCGVIHLGFADPNADRSVFAERIRMSGYDQDYVFLPETVEKGALVTAPGEELYVVVPAEEVTQITVYTWEYTEADNYEGSQGAVLYESAGRAPFLLQCNTNENQPNTLIVMQGGGKTLRWNPRMSTVDIGVDTDQGQGRVIDFTWWDVDPGYDGDEG